MTQHRFDELREFLTFCEMDFHEGKLTRNLEDTCNRMANLLFGTKGKAAIHGARNGSVKNKKKRYGNKEN